MFCLIVGKLAQTAFMLQCVSYTLHATAGTFYFPVHCVGKHLKLDNPSEKR